MFYFSSSLSLTHSPFIISLIHSFYFLLFIIFPLFSFASKQITTAVAARQQQQHRRREEEKEELVDEQERRK